MVNRILPEQHDLPLHLDPAISEFGIQQHNLYKQTRINNLRHDTIIQIPQGWF